MARHHSNIIFAGVSIILAVVFLSIQADAADITATVHLGLCGDSIIGAGEQCDGSTLGGATCVSRGYAGGSLSCAASCEFNTSACTSASSGGGGGGGGGGGSIAPVTPTSGAVFSGRAYPKTTVTLLKDAQVAATTIAGADAMFSITLSGLSSGNYIFSVYSEDTKGVRSSLMTFPTSITSGVTANVSGIFIAPTISVDKSEVKRGDTITIFGQSVPQADIIIAVNSEEEFFSKTISDKEGVYVYNFDSSLLEYGSHAAKSKASVGNQLVTGFSYLINFKVGTKNVLAEKPAQSVLKGDSNNDKRVNLIDFSILAYWFNRPLTAIPTTTSG